MKTSFYSYQQSKALDSQMSSLDQTRVEWYMELTWPRGQVDVCADLERE